MAGLTTTGLTIKDLQEIIAEFVADEVANIDADLNTEADSVVGQLNAIYGAALNSLWELFEGLYQSGYADTASGQSLSWIAALTGTIRQPATKSTLAVTFDGTNSTVVPVGTEVYVDGDPQSRFVSTEAVTISGGSTATTLQAVTAGSSTTAALASDSLIIATPVTGLDTVTITADAVQGEDEETDSELRARRLVELARAASATVDAIRAEVSQVTGVDAVIVFENVTSGTDSEGLPPGAIEVIVYSDGSPTLDTSTLGQTIWDAKPAGTLAHGDIALSATDDAGNTQAVNYSTPDAVTVHIELSVTYDGDVYASDAACQTAVEDDIAAWASANLSIGDDVHAADIIARVVALNGIITVDPSTVQVEDSDPPGLTTQAITTREIASISTTNIDVTATEG